MPILYCNSTNTKPGPARSVSIPVGALHQVSAIGVADAVFPSLPLTIPHGSTLHWTTSTGESYTATVPAQMYNSRQLAEAIAGAMAGQMTDSYVAVGLEGGQLDISISTSRRATWDGQVATVDHPDVEAGDAIRVGDTIYHVAKVGQGTLTVEEEMAEPGPIYFYYPVSFHKTVFSRQLGLTHNSYQSVHRSSQVTLESVDHAYLQILGDDGEPITTDVLGAPPGTLTQLVFGMGDAHCHPTTVETDFGDCSRSLNLRLAYPGGELIPLHEHRWHLVLELDMKQERWE